MSITQLNPKSTEVLQSFTRYNNLVSKQDVIAVNSSNFTANPAPNVLMFGDGDVRLLGSVVAAGTPAANYALGTLPTYLNPLQDTYQKVTVLRAGALIDNAIKINGSGNSIASVTVTAAGSYATLPTVALSGPGAGAILSPVMKAVSATLSAAGTVYAPGDTITATGGTASQNAIFNVTNTKLITAAVNAAGTGYVPTNTITTTVVGGTATTVPILTVATTKVVSATVAAGGSGGTPGTQTVTGTTGTGTPFQASVTVSGGGAISAVLSITVAGSYTANPTVIAAEPVTGASLTGAQLSVVMGAATVTASTAGVFTTNGTSLTQASTSGSGAGATFNTLVFGVNAVTPSVSTPGAYTVLPSNPVAQGSTSGSGTGATLTVLWGLLSVTVSNGGSGYSAASTFSLSGGGGAGGAVGALVLDSTSGQITLITAPNVGDVVYLNCPLLVSSYA